MKRLALVAVVALLAVGCATTGGHERAGGGVGGTAPSMTSAPAVDPGASGGAAVRTTRAEGAPDQALAALDEGLRSVAVDQTGRARDAGKGGPGDRATLKQKIEPMLKKGIPDGKDEDVFTGGIDKGASPQNSNPRKGKHSAAGQIERMERFKKAMEAVQYLLRKGKGSRADDGFSGESVERAKQAAEGDNPQSGPQTTQERLQAGIDKVHYLMKRGKGSVGDDGFSGDSIRAADWKSMNAGAARNSRAESPQDLVRQFRIKSVAQPAGGEDKGCTGARCQGR